MTIDSAPVRSRGQRALRWFGGAALALLGWAAIMLVMPFVGPSGRDVAIVGSSAQTIEVVRQAGGDIVDIRRGAILARSDKPGFVSRLYRAGAPLVIEGRIASGCFAAR